MSNYHEPAMYITQSDLEDLQNSGREIYAYFDPSEVEQDNGDEVVKVSVTEDSDFEDIFVAASSTDSARRITLVSTPILDDGGLAIPVDVKFVSAII